MSHRSGQFLGLQADGSCSYEFGHRRLVVSVQRGALDWLAGRSGTLLNDHSIEAFAEASIPELNPIADHKLRLDEPLEISEADVRQVYGQS